MSKMISKGDQVAPLPGYRDHGDGRRKPFANAAVIGSASTAALILAGCSTDADCPSQPQSTIGAEMSTQEEKPSEEQLGLAAEIIIDELSDVLSRADGDNSGGWEPGVWAGVRYDGLFLSDVRAENPNVEGSEIASSVIYHVADDGRLLEDDGQRYSYTVSCLVTDHLQGIYDDYSVEINTDTEPDLTDWGSFIESQFGAEVTVDGFEYSLANYLAGVLGISHDEETTADLEQVVKGCTSQTN